MMTGVENKNHLDSLNKFISKFNLSIDDNLLMQAFTHPSNKNINDFLKDYNSLEFLGDATLNLLVTDLIYEKFEGDEGSLTISRSNIVNNKILAKFGKNLGIDQLIIIPENYNITDGDVADCFEAFLGAIYLQHGFIECQTFFQKFIVGYVNQLLLENPLVSQINAVNQLQEYFQKKHLEILEPTYNKIGEDNSPIYYCNYETKVKNSVISVRGTGKNKKEAKNRAAEELLKQLQLIDNFTNE